jgi:hypothetical protein
VTFSYSTIEIDEFVADEPLNRFLRKNAENLTVALRYEAKEGGRAAAEAIKRFVEARR